MNIFFFVLFLGSKIKEIFSITQDNSYGRMRKYSVQEMGHVKLSDRKYPESFANAETETRDLTKGKT